MFEFKINLSHDDYILFNNYSFLNSPSGKRLLMINKMMIPIFCFLCVVVLIAFNLDVLLILIEAIVLTILSILWIFFDKKIFLRILDKNLRKTEKEGRLSFEGEAVLILSKEEAQNAPTPVTTYALFFEGEYVTNEQMSDKKFLKLAGK